MVRFFAIVRQCPPYGIGVLGVVTLLGVVTVELNPAELDSALGMILFVQMFLASSGVAAAARRGHFDPVLVHGCERAPALVCQWVASIAPGAIAWAVVAGCGYAWSSPAAWSALLGTRLAAFLMISAVAWVAGFMAPRGGGGALWMGLLLVLLLRHADLVTPGAPQESAIAVARTAGALLVCPFLLLGTHGQIGVPAVVAASSAAAALLFTTIRLGVRLDVFLVERS